jgi:branched-chain amino acid transport system ATP-binding protein
VSAHLPLGPGPTPSRERGASGEAAQGAASQPLLEVNGIEVIYNHVILVLKGVSLAVPRGGIVALLGANGAGKTTTLRAISNLLRAERGEVSKGRIVYAGERVEGLSPFELVRRGVVQVMEGRRCFGHLSIEENLLTGAYMREARVRVRGDLGEALERVYAYFPRLKTRRASQAGVTSGGEQQMCAIGRALMARPAMILLDEPSMGLAPQVVEEIFGIVRDLNEREGVTFLLAEQNAHLALRYARHGYILEGGRVVMDGTAQALTSNEDVKEFYLGLSRDGRRSFRDSKFYRRRKRWLT